MYDMDLCVDYVEIPERERDEYLGALAVMRIGLRIWGLMYEVSATYPEWFELCIDFDFDGHFWDYANNLIDRHYLELEHGKTFGSVPLANGAL